MKHRTYALLLATALTLSLLAGCGPKDSDTSGSQPSGSDVSSSQEDTSMPDASTPDESLPDASTSTPDGSTSTPDGSQADSSQEEVVEEPEVKASLGLDTADFTLFSKGASHTLKATVTPAGTKVTFQSGNEKVATVDANGKVTAVAPGTAKITATAGDLTATCIVRCRWEESKPDQGGSSSSGSGSSNSGSGSGSSSSNGGSSSTPSTDKVDLADFYSTVTSSYEMPGMTLADSQLMDQYFAGLSDVATEQSQVYVNMLTMNMGELALIQVKDSKDVDTVKAIFQARIDYMVQSGAWYPQCVELWTNNAQVVSNGNYIMMVASEDCDSIVKDFNALF